ncbi:restriction endonuclease [Spongisporangium articulatum]|uniref:Restriction endonuclease n=1 Tax=Spongisporangium articulatum TaxID=3362603 RepID=A0ABW8AL17_9ACTN
MARRRRKKQGDVAVPLMGGFLIIVLIVAALQSLYEWLAAHWYVALFILLVAGYAGYSSFIAWRHRVAERAERLANVRLTLGHIDLLTPSQFETACRDLLRRDGLRAECVGGSNDQALDVKATDPFGRVVAVQCKHTTVGKNVGSPVLYQVNGTARQVHGAHIVVVVTNGGFSRNARLFAAQHQIHLIGRAELERWASQGHGFHDLIGVPLPSTQGS